MALPETYRKIIANRLSTDFRAVTEIVEIPLKPPAAGEVVVRNIYAGINASDVNASAGGYSPGQKPPLDMGLEALGEVAAVGPGVDTLKEGDTVVAMGLGVGFCEYFTAPASRVIRVTAAKPEYMTLIISGLTAAFGLYPVGEMKAGETVLVTAAAGGTGQFAVQLAKLEGCHVIGTCSTPEKVDFLKKLGCDRVINYREENIAEVLKSEYRNRLDVVYESVGRGFFDAAVDNLAIRGRLVVIGAISEYTEAPERITAPRVGMKLLMKSASIRGMLLFHFFDYLPKYLRMLVDLVDQGKLHVEIDPTEFNGLEQCVDAVEYLHSGQSTGKVIVRL